jgi:hypothetical protein
MHKLSLPEAITAPEDANIAAGSLEDIGIELQLLDHRRFVTDDFHAA